MNYKDELCYICDKPTNELYYNKYDKTRTYYVCNYCSETLELKHMIMTYSDKTLSENK